MPKVLLPLGDATGLVDGNLVTARTYHDNTLLLKSFIQMLKAAAANE